MATLSEYNSEWLKYDGLKIRVDGKLWKVRASTHEAIYPYRHTSLHVEASIVDRNDPEYVETRRKLGDDWSTDVLESDSLVWLLAARKAHARMQSNA